MYNSNSTDNLGANMSTILVKFGEYRNKPIINQKFTLVKDFQTGKKGNFITVKNEGQFDIAISEIRVKVNSINDVVFVDGESKMTENTIAFKAKESTSVESDEQAMDRIATRFKVLDEMTTAAINSDIRAMIVSGPPGVGKSFGVETQLEKASMFDKISGK